MLSSYQQFQMVEDSTTKMKFLFFGKEIYKTDLTSFYSHCPHVVTMLHIHLGIQSVVKMIYPKQ